MPTENRNPKNTWPYWLAGALAVLLIIIFILKKDKANEHITANAASDSTTVESQINNNWTGVDPNLPDADYDEVRDSDLQVRANKDYAVYSLNETVLFKSGEDKLEPKGMSKLKMITASATKRFSNGTFLIYGYTDSTGTKNENKELATKRVNAVKTWLVEFGKISGDRVTVNPVGESSPAFTNSTEQGRKKNRRVDIVVRNN